MMMLLLAWIGFFPDAFVVQQVFFGTVSGVGSVGGRLT